MGKVKRQTHLLFGSLLIFGLIHLYKCDGADFLGVRQRFNDSSHYDYLYCCNICDGVLRWIVDGTDVINHLISQTIAGSVKSVNSSINSNSLRYSSLILSKRPKGNLMCLDAVLMFTQDSPYERPVVQCRSNRDSFTIQYQNQIIAKNVTDVSSPSVTVRNTENSHRDVVSPGNGCSTQIILCRTSGNFLRWTNASSSALFNGISRAGSSQFSLHPADNNITLWNTVVLERNEQFTTSAIIWTDYISAGSYNVTCQSHTDEITTMVNAPIIIQPTLISTSGSISSVTSVSRSLISAHEPLRYYVTSVVAALMIAIWFSTA